MLYSYIPLRIDTDLIAKAERGHNGINSCVFITLLRLKSIYHPPAGPILDTDNDGLKATSRALLDSVPITLALQRLNGSI